MAGLVEPLGALSGKSCWENRVRQEQYCRDTQYHKPHPRGLITKSWLRKQVGFLFLRLLFRAQHGNRGGGDPHLEELGVIRAVLAGLCL